MSRERLVKEGYRIVYPEAMDVAEQIKIYGGAKKIIIATGSAAHMLAHTCSSEHSVALLHRHSRVWPGFGRQLRLFGVVKIIELDCMAGYFLPSETADDIFPIFTLIVEKLKCTDFVSGDWHEVPEAVSMAEKAGTIKALSEEYGGLSFSCFDTD